ncbi:MAG: hypothetical protein KIT87_11955 [Anaerolineae bacterium]|nr:hypothetical protein [Anaerolineae bacterium]
MPLHFRTSLQMNAGWLRRVSVATPQNIDKLVVPYGDLKLQVVFRGADAEYAQHQLTMLFRFVEEYGGLGARLQHGFGQVQLKPSQAGLDTSMAAGLTELVVKLGPGGLRTDGPSVNTPYDLRQFASLTFDVPISQLSRFMSVRAHVGNNQKRNESRYIPCAFDLRYKGAEGLGMRRWLEENRQWNEADINLLMGVRETKRSKMKDEDRQGSRVCFGMPYQMNGGSYRLRVFGFAPPALLTANELQALCAEYVESALNVKPRTTILGTDLIAQVRGGEQ